MKPPGVVPALNPRKDRQAGLGLGLPDAPVNQFTLQRGKETLGHGVIVCIAHAAHAGAHTHLLAAVAKLDAGVLAALVRVVNHRLGLAGHQGHVQRLRHQISRHAHAKRPAHHLAAEYIRDCGQVQKPRPGGQVGHVGHPQLVDVAGHKLAVYQVWGRALTWIALGRDAVTAPAADPAPVVVAHQAGHPFAACDHAFITQLRSHARHAVGVIAGVERGLDLHRQGFIGLLAGAGRTIHPVVIAALGDLKCFTHGAYR